jgi:hypothetical protein
MGPASLRVWRGSPQNHRGESLDPAKCPRRLNERLLGLRFCRGGPSEACGGFRTDWKWVGSAVRRWEARRSPEFVSRWRVQHGRHLALAEFKRRSSDRHNFRHQRILVRWRLSAPGEMEMDPADRLGEAHANRIHLVGGSDRRELRKGDVMESLPGVATPFNLRDSTRCLPFCTPGVRRTDELWALPESRARAASFPAWSKVFP